MSLREKLLLLVIPLVVLPPVVVTTVLLPLFGADPQYSNTAYYIVACCAIIITLGVGIFMAFHIAHTIAQPLGQLTCEAKNVSMGDFGGHIEIPETACNEAHILAETIEKMKSDLKVREELELRNAGHIAAGKLASQVAHDLAGPLSSLQVAVSHFKAPDPSASHENLVNLLDLSTKRLATISAGLLDHYEGGKSREIAFSLHSVIDELLGEYQVQDNYQSIEFVKEYDHDQILLFGNRSRLQRAFANIIKNAIEAMEGIGSVAVKVFIASDAAQIRITDTGPGMSEELISRIEKGGVTHGKKNGHGIGMSVVREVIEEYSGELRIESEMGMGTTFSIILPLPQSTALRHVERDVHLVEQLELNLDNVDSIAVIDDDASIRLQWQMIFEKAGWPCEQYESWEDYHKISSCKSSIAKTFFVLDCHFNNSLVSGIDIARKLRCMGATHMILATAEYWKPTIREATQQLDITLCPKPLPKIVIASETKQSSGIAAAPSEPRNDKSTTSILLIDDDPAMHIAWKMKCKLWGVPHFQAFLNMEDCTKSPMDYAKIDAAFIDKNIAGSSWAMDTTITHLKSNGVKKVWIASGESTHELESDPLCAGADGVVKGKMPDNITEYLS